MDQETRAASTSNPESSQIGGFVEGVTGSDLYGWIINRTRPEALEEVHVHGAADMLAFRSFYYRADVCRVIGVAGRSGFALPLHLLRGLGTNLRITNRFGMPLDGGNIVLPPLAGEAAERAADNAPTYIFLHMQKTGGTSIRDALAPRLPMSAQLYLYPRPEYLTPAELVSMPIIQRRAFRLIFTHSHIGVGRLLGREVRYLTILRDPIARIESQYWHYRATTGEYLKIEGRPIPLSVLVNEGIGEEFDNLQTRYMAGLDPSLVPFNALSKDALDLALYNAKKYFEIIGDFTKIDQVFGEICALLGLERFPLPRHNAANPAVVDRSDPDYCKINWQAVTRRHQLDIELYERLCMNQ